MLAQTFRKSKYRRPQLLSATNLPKILSHDSLLSQFPSMEGWQPKADEVVENLAMVFGIG